MEQDWDWALRCWPYALLDQKNGAIAKASVPIPSIRGSLRCPSEIDPSRSEM